MKCFGFFFLAALFTSTVAYSTDDAVTRAMKLYEKRHYAEAATTLRADLQTIEPGKQGTAQLTLGMIYLKNAELHRDLYQESLTVHQDYLKKLSSDQGKSRSRFVDLYLGETLLESGNVEPALRYLEKFSADDNNVGSRYKNEARVAIGLCFALQNNSQKAGEAWNSADIGDPEGKTALAAAYSKAGLKDKKPVVLVDEGLADLKKSGTAPSLQSLKNVITVYAAAGRADEGLELLRKADLKSFSYKESLGKTKVINFYDVSLLGDLSSLYLQAAISALEKAAGDGKLRETANFYLGEAYALVSDWKKLWHPRGDKTAGPVKRGLGLSLHTWGGGGHASRGTITIHPDG